MLLSKKKGVRKTERDGVIYYIYIKKTTVAAGSDGRKREPTKIMFIYLALSVNVIFSNFKGINEFHGGFSVG
jgi:hypothetical protein